MFFLLCVTSGVIAETRQEVDEAVVFKAPGGLHVLQFGTPSLEYDLEIF